jgi:Holliday junction DNA helicase RuvB
MAVERLVSPTSQPAMDAGAPGEQERNWSLRPKRLQEYIGQSQLIEKLSIAINAAKGRGDPMEHVLLHGPPGLGKTTLAHVIGQEMGTRVHITSGPALTKPGDLVSVLTQLEPNDLLFIDEIHRLPISVEEFIYPAMEDFRIDVRVESGMHARTVQVSLKPFTLVGATTRAGLVSGPMYSRFGIHHSLAYYAESELVQILSRSAKLLELDADRGAMERIASRSRGTPRIANRLLRRVRDFASVKGNGRITPEMVRQALDLEGVDERGLDELDRAYLKVIATTYSGGPVGPEAIAATLNHDAGTLVDVVEPYLLQVGFLARTRRGRALTKGGAEHIGMPQAAVVGGANSGLFEAE